MEQMFTLYESPDGAFWSMTNNTTTIYTIRALSSKQAWWCYHNKMIAKNATGAGIINVEKIESATIK